MADTSNPTGRVIDVLNFLAAHPTEAFSLAEIARHLDLSNGSAHRILTTLAAARFLTRNEKRRTYSLGMALVAIGQAALEKHRGIERARSELARLAVDLNVQCSANAVVDDEIVVLVKEGTAQSHRGLTRVGERRPLVPPLGLCHVAWGGETAIAAYVESVSPHIGEAVRSHLLASFPLIRRRGYSIAAHGPGASHSRDIMADPDIENRFQTYRQSIGEMVGLLTPNEVQLFELDHAGGEVISHITAPVFSPTGAVSLQLVISGMPSNLARAEIVRYAEKLCATAALITSETHGRRPQG